MQENVDVAGDYVVLTGEKISAENNDDERYIGRKVIHNPEGVCIITAMSNLNTSLFEARNYYKLVPVEDQTMAVYVPVESVKDHVRDLRSTEEILSILESCEKAKTPWDNSEQRRIAKRRNAMQNDDGVVLSKLIKTYHKRKEKNHLSVADSNWLKKAEQFLGSEIAEVLKIDIKQAISRMTE